MRDLTIDPQTTQLVDHPTDSDTVYRLTVVGDQPPPPAITATDCSRQGGLPTTTETVLQRVVLAPPQLGAFTATSASVVKGSPVTLAWTGSGYTSLSLRMGADENDESQPEQPVDPRIVQLTEQPDATTWYTLTATNAAGSVSRQLQVTVSAAAVPLPKLDFFVATPPTVTEGGTMTLSFSAQNVDSVLLRDAKGRTILQQDTGGGSSVLQNVDVVPDQTEAFVLTLSNAGGQLTQAVSVQVTPQPPTPTPLPSTEPTDTAPQPAGP
jgi:hypothetical protein